MKFALATANTGKIKEIQTILGARGIDIVTRSELGIDFDIEETGNTFLANATLKAKAICEATGLPAIADDSGLCVDALGGAPGVWTSSFGGEGLTDAERRSYLLDCMKNEEHRGAKFVCTIVCIFPDGGMIVATGECRGEIPLLPAGTGGFGYDPVFRAAGMDRTNAELTSDEKNIISHRGKALRQFAELYSTSVYYVAEKENNE